MPPTPAFSRLLSAFPRALEGWVEGGSLSCALLEIPNRMPGSDMWQAPNRSHEWALGMEKYPETFKCADVRLSFLNIENQNQLSIHKGLDEYFKPQPVGWGLCGHQVLPLPSTAVVSKTSQATQMQALSRVSTLPTPRSQLTRQKSKYSHQKPQIQSETHSFARGRARGENQEKETWSCSPMCDQWHSGPLLCPHNTRERVTLALLAQTAQC